MFEHLFAPIKIRDMELKTELFAGYGNENGGGKRGSDR